MNTTSDKAIGKISSILEENDGNGLVKFMKLVIYLSQFHKDGSINPYVLARAHLCDFTYPNLNSTEILIKQNELRTLL